ncbi:MAG: class I SAM-dependent methyltransferase [Pseudomonadota bacterium]
MNDKNCKDIYDPVAVAELFDRCSTRYRWWSAIASFGMTRIWRIVCINSLPASTKQEGEFLDLMAGTGEVWPHLLRRYPKLSSIKAVDNSRKMHDDAILRLHSSRSGRCTHILANALEVDLPKDSADSVVSTFGLKTFNSEQLVQIARQVNRTLRTGGTFSFIEASDPVNWQLRPLYRFYMDRCLPLIERFALQGAQDFSMIGTYTKNFKNCDAFAEALRSEGLVVNSYTHFFGCATGVFGHKRELE